MLESGTLLIVESFRVGVGNHPYFAAMSMIYLIRHGQAGSRDNYDVLSELGQQQSHLLGNHLAEQRVSFDAIVSGVLNRQQQTAHIVAECLGESSASVPGLVIDERWNEFSLLNVYRGLAPRLIAESEGFARDYEQMQSDLIADPHATRGAAGRCDRQVIEAWMENRYPDYGGQSWEDFCARAHGSFGDLAARSPEDNVAIFTSATPIAIWVGAALALSNERMLRLMAVLYNSSLTMLKIRSGEPLLLSFNATPHLIDSSHKTFR